MIRSVVASSRNSPFLGDWKPPLLRTLTEQPPTQVFLEIGGGGMGAGVAAIMKQRFPEAKLIIVEAVDQNSMGVFTR